jgi:hypothetical protein
VFGAQPISRATRHARHSSRSSASMVSMLHIRGAWVRTPSFTLHPRAGPPQAAYFSSMVPIDEYLIGRGPVSNIRMLPAES